MKIRNIRIHNFRSIKEVKFADVDRDGDLDLFVGELYMDEDSLTKNRLFLNDGDGYYDDATDLFNVELGQDTVATRGFEAEFADIDNDQDLDLMVARLSTYGKSDYNDDLFLNLYTQLFVYPLSPKPNQTVNLVQTGIEGASFDIYACLDTVFEWDLPHGVLRLDTTALSHVFVDSGTFDSTEIDTLQFTVPNDTSLVGEDIFLQTIITEDSTDWTYGNLEKVTVSAP